MIAMRPYELYQYVPDGKSTSRKNRREKNSKFWNEGKFNNFVVPCLPEDPTDMAFADMGCNMGLFLKLAKDYGFRNAVGIEQHQGAFERGVSWRDSNGYDYRMINATIQAMTDNLPLADVTLLSNVHYYLKVAQWVRYVDMIRSRTRYLIIINILPSRNRSHWLVVKNIERYFSEWKFVKKIRISTAGDLAPRNIRGFLFESPMIKRVAIDDIADFKNKNILHDFYQGDEAGYRRHWQRWKWKKSNGKKRYYDHRKVDRILQIKRRVLPSIKDEGQQLPILLNKNNEIRDGIHRISAMRVLGYKSILARYI